MFNGEGISLVAVPDMMPLARAVHRIMAERNMLVRTVTPIEINRFKDGITLPKITQSIRRTEVYVFYTPPREQPDLGFAELGKILNAAHFGSVKSIKIILPHFWEGRADRKSEARTSTNVKELARVIEHHDTVDGLFTFDLHAEQIVLAFNRVPVDDLKGQTLLAAYAATFPGWAPETVGVVAPDVGSVKRAEKFAKRSGFPFKGLVYKERTGANTSEAKRYIGDSIKGLHVILPDDLIDTAGTIIGAGAMMQKQGAASVTACTTHWLGSKKADPNNKSCPITAEGKFREAGIRVLALNTIPRTVKYLHESSDFLTMIPCDELLASAIIASLTPGASISKLSE